MYELLLEEVGIGQDESRVIRDGEGGDGDGQMLRVMMGLVSGDDHGEGATMMWAADDDQR